MSAISFRRRRRGGRNRQSRAGEGKMGGGGWRWTLFVRRRGLKR